jgi:hypothetical protein
MVSFQTQFDEARDKSKTRYLWPVIFEGFYERWPNPQAELADLRAEIGGEVDEGPVKSKKRSSKEKAMSKEASWPVYSDIETWKTTREKVSCQRIRF